MQTTLLNFLQRNETPLQAVLTTKTVVKLNKKSKDKTKVNPFTTVYKIQTVVIGLNENYEKLVKQQQAVEGVTTNFEAEKLPWGKHICKAVIEHNSNLYLQSVIIGKRGKTQYVNAMGHSISFNEFEDFLPTKSVNTKQNLTDTVNVRTFKFENIVKLAITTNELVLVFTNS